MQRTGLEKSIETSAHRLEHREKSVGTSARRFGDREVARSGRQIPTEDAGCHDPTIEQRRQPFARTAIAKLSEHESDVLVLSRDAPARAQRAIERLVHEPRHLGFVGHLETRIQVGLEREFAEQRQAERVDRADRDIRQSGREVLASARRKTPPVRRPGAAS